MTISIELKEDLDAATMAGLKDTIESLAQSKSDVEFDLSKVQFIDSSGVGGFVYLYKRLRASGHNLWLHGANNQPKRLLTYVGLLSLTERPDAGMST